MKWTQCCISTTDLKELKSSVTAFKTSTIAVKQLKSSTVKYYSAALFEWSHWRISTTNLKELKSGAPNQSFRWKASHLKIRYQLQSRIFFRKMSPQTFIIVREKFVSNDPEETKIFWCLKSRQSDEWNNLFVSSKQKYFHNTEKKVCF